MKICRCCRKEKKDDEFYKRKSNSDGLYSYCKSCTSDHAKRSHHENKDKRKDKQRKYRELNAKIINERSRQYYYKNKEEILEKSEKYRKENRKKISIREAERRLKDLNRFEKNREKHYKWSSKNRERINKYQREWYQKNKEKRKAHVILKRAIEEGKLVRPNKCSECKKECKPDGHHIDYQKPLDVIWICRACHSRKSPRTVEIT